MCKGIILNGESLYLLCCCYIIAHLESDEVYDKKSKDVHGDIRHLEKAQ